MLGLLTEQKEGRRQHRHHGQQEEQQTLPIKNKWSGGRNLINSFTLKERPGKARSR